jgi:hypothetical protein
MRYERVSNVFSLNRCFFYILEKSVRESSIEKLKFICITQVYLGVGIFVCAVIAVTKQNDYLDFLHYYFIGGFTCGITVCVNNIYCHLLKRWHIFILFIRETFLVPIVAEVNWKNLGGSRSMNDIIFILEFLYKSL